MPIHSFVLVFDIPNNQSLCPCSINGGYISSWDGAIIPAGYYAVDTFFLMGSFLATYYILRHLAPSGGGSSASTSSSSDSKRRPPSTGSFILKGIPGIYLHRWLRLTPAYGFILFVFVAFVPYIIDGPFTITMDKELRNCHEVSVTTLILLLGCLWPLACQ